MTRDPMTLLLLLAGLAAASPLAVAADEPLRVFLRGGEKTHNPVDNGQHDYPGFLGDWTKLLQGRGAHVDGALHFPGATDLEHTDVLVIHAGDGGTIAAPDREVLEAYLRRGGGLVILHDGMCSDDPGWFATLAGAAKKHGEMNWTRGKLPLHVKDPDHPTTRGMGDFAMDDEAFFLLRRAPGMHVLLEAALPSNGEVEPQAWSFEATLPGGKPHRSFVWMQGHWTARLLEPEARDFILRGIAWTARRPVDALLREVPPPRQ